MKIAIASDHAAYDLRCALKSDLAAAGHAVEDLGCEDKNSVDYPGYARAVAEAVREGRVERGIAVCGTGIGMSMAANKVPGVRAALVHDAFTARMSREHNDANVLCLGARVLPEQTALEIARTWLDTAFEGGRHSRRVDAIE